MASLLFATESARRFQCAPFFRAESKRQLPLVLHPSKYKFLSFVGRIPLRHHGVIPVSRASVRQRPRSRLRNHAWPRLKDAGVLLIRTSAGHQQTLRIALSLQDEVDAAVKVPSLGIEFVL